MLQRTHRSTFSPNFVVIKVTVSEKMDVTDTQTGRKTKDLERCTFYVTHMSVIYRRTALKVCSAISTVWDDVAFIIVVVEITHIYNIRSTSPISQVKKA